MPATSPHASPSPSRTVLVTGASSGIGRQLCLQLAQQGHTVLALARSPSPLQQLAEQQAGIVPLAADLADLADLPRLARQLQHTHPDLAVVVHNAGVQHSRGARMGRTPAARACAPGG